MNYNFQWDPLKARSNTVKHKVRFEDAASVFADPSTITIYDEDHSEFEDRWITIGLDLFTRTIVVVHTFIVISNDSAIIRIISARRATPKEKEQYYEK